jgi:heme/copper-type cytochrome/quinol oxidase subunit 4
MTSTTNTSEPRISQYIVVYICILVLAGLQFVIAYSSLTPHKMLARMLFVAGVEAVLGVMFFMHLWAEKRGFVIFVAVFTLFVLAAMQYGWTDSFRLITCGGKCS